MIDKRGDSMQIVQLRALMALPLDLKGKSTYNSTHSAPSNGVDVKMVVVPPAQKNTVYLLCHNPKDDVNHRYVIDTAIKNRFLTKEGGNVMSQPEYAIRYMNS